MHIGLDQNREFLAARLVDLRHHLFKRGTGHTGAALFTALAFTIIGDFTGTGFIRHHVKTVTRFWCRVQAQHFHRNRRTSGFQLFTLFVDKCAHPAPGGTGHENIAMLQGAALYEYGGNRATTLVKLGFDDQTTGFTIRVGLEVENFGLQQNRIQQLVKIGAFEG